MLKHEVYVTILSYVSGLRGVLRRLISGYSFDIDRRSADIERTHKRGNNQLPRRKDIRVGKTNQGAPGNNNKCSPRNPTANTNSTRDNTKGQKKGTNSNWIKHQMQNKKKKVSHKLHANKTGNNRHSIQITRINANSLMERGGR